MSTANRFQFIGDRTHSGVTLLNAVMSDFSYGRHAHEEFAVGITLAGLQEFTCRGSRFRSAPGDIILFNPGDVHNGNPGDKAALEYIMLYMDSGEFYPLVACAGHRIGPECRMPENHFRDPVLKSLILKMSTLISHERKSAIEYEHCLYELAAGLAKRLGLFRPDAWKRDKDTLLMRVREYMHDNIAEDISIDLLSGVANMSKFHFIRLFRTQFGLTPHKYLLNLRVNRARNLLELGTAPTDAAQELGFFDVSHLNRHFKRVYGLTPKQYQVQLFK